MWGGLSDFRPGVPTCGEVFTSCKDGDVPAGTVGNPWGYGDCGGEGTRDNCECFRGTMKRRTDAKLRLGE